MAWVVLIKIGYSITPIFNLKDSLNIIKNLLNTFTALYGATYTRVGVILTKIFIRILGGYLLLMRLFEIIIEFAMLYKPNAKIIQMIEHNGEYNSFSCI